MGLDFAHTAPGGHHCPHWSYGGFAQFRRRIAQAEGFDLDTMQRYGGDRDWDTVDTGLKPLLDHSDAEGEIGPEDCAAVARRLREVVPEWPWDGTISSMYDQRDALALAECMEICAANNEPLVFC